MKNQELENIQLLKRAMEIAGNVNEKLEKCYQQHQKATKQAA